MKRSEFELNRIFSGMPDQEKEVFLEFLHWNGESNVTEQSLLASLAMSLAIKQSLSNQHKN
ncbi:hypothetical protein ACP2AV_05835 [Aliiroseovarius sp. PTFE2010]